MSENIREAILAAEIACSEDDLDRAEDALQAALSRVRKQKSEVNTA